MLPERFLKLCLREFATREQAIAAAGYGDTSVLRYLVPTAVLRVPPSGEIPIHPPAEEREIRLRQLPSGFWAYILSIQTILLN